ncbi:RNA recognition motif domain [Trinorchestia longiramus]|nr:RNA recognition motif domain [Trinorchestia longiramus]
MKKLEDMRVIELRAELEKRNLDKNGVKVVLIERLRKALEESGESQTAEDMVDANNSEEELHASNDEAAEQNGHSRQDFDENSCNDESKDASYLGESGDMRVTDQVGEQDYDDASRMDDKEQNLTKRSSDQSYERGAREHSWSRDGGEEQRDYRGDRLDDDDDSRFNDGDESRFNDGDRSHFTDDHSRFTDEHNRFTDDDSRLSSEARNNEGADRRARDTEGKLRDDDGEEHRYSEAENSAEATEFSKRSDDAAPASAGNFEDEINFMVDEDDNMLDEEMIYEDGTTNRTGQDDGSIVDGKADSSTGQHSNKKTTCGNSSSSSGQKDASDGTAEGREGGDSATADAESTTAEGANEDSSTKNTSANLDSSEKKSDAESASREDGANDPKSASSGRNLWVSGLSSSTRAQELKSHFSKHGKVISAKIVTSAKSPGSKCYGFITMSSTDEASVCIKNLNKTELRGRIIQVERAKDDPSANTRHSLGRGERDPHGLHRSGSHDPRRRSEHPDDMRGSSREHSRDRHGRPRVVDHRYGAPRPIRALGPRLGHNMPFREDGPRGNLSRRLSSRLSPSALRKLSPRHMEKQPLGISQIVEERERQRGRVRERLIREDERRAREEETRQRMIERRQREEAERLQREREALRAERERIERQKQELLRLEREQQRLEREKLEREREELRRQQMKLAHGPDRMDVKAVLPRYEDPRGGRSLKRPADDRGNRGDHYDDRKRAALDRMGGDSRQRYVPPAPPVHSRRYESGSRSDSHRYEGNSYGGREGGSSGGRFDRSGGPMGGGPSKPSHPPGDHMRWMPSGPGGAPGASNGRRSDGYYDDRRGDGRNSGSSGSESRNSRNYHVSFIAPPPGPSIVRSGDSSSRMNRDSGGKASYGGGSSGGTDVWRTGSSKSGGYGGSGSSSSKSVYGSSSNNKSAYAGPSDSSSSGGLLPAPHDSGTWRGSVSSSSTSSRWPSDSRGGGSSGGGGGGGGGSSSSGVGGSSSVPSYGGSGLPSSITSHHASVPTVPSQETRGSYGVPAAPYRKY